MFCHGLAGGSSPNCESASGSPVRARISAEWIQKPTNASTVAPSLSRRSSQKNLPDCDCWSTTIWSATLHQSCSGTQERAIARIESSRLLDKAYHDALLLLDRETPIVFQCHHGIRSQHAAEYFQGHGFTNLYNLRGGIDAWSLFVDPAVPRY